MADVHEPQRAETFREFLYNPENKTVFGRTASSWGKIGFFYLIFYSCLAGFFAAMLAVFFTTLDMENHPTYSPGDGSSLLRNPALGYRPLPKEDNVESTTIWYHVDQPDDMSHWITQLTDFVKAYKTQDPVMYKNCDNGESDLTDARPCLFSASQLGDLCTEANEWGFPEGSPCVILKLNKMMGWIPEYYETIEELPEDLPDSLKAYINSTIPKSNNEDKTIPKMVWMSCEGDEPVDHEYAPDMEFYPHPGFSSVFFPYFKIPGYQSPLVALKIQNPKRNVIINMECKIWAKNINHDSKNRLGMVQFELLID